MLKVILEIAGIAVTTVSIVVTVIGIRQTKKIIKHQKSNRPSQG